MWGNYFYHKIIRKTVTTFGTLFNNIQLKTLDANGSLVVEQKVPLAYGPVQKFLARLTQSPDLDKKVTVTAMIIPIIPKKFPCLDVSGDDKPLNARINNTPEIR